MPAFQSKKFRPSSYRNSLGAFYRKNLNSHPFLLFGLPFIFTIVAGMYIFRAYSPYFGRLFQVQDMLKKRGLFILLFTVLVVGNCALEKYERHDRKVQQMTKEEELGIGKDRRRVDINEEYYRLAAKDLDDWENKRVKRLPGETDGV